jgi:hypothetical protein
VKEPAVAEQAPALKVQPEAPQPAILKVAQPRPPEPRIAKPPVVKPAVVKIAPATKVAKSAATDPIVAGSAGKTARMKQRG